MKRIITTLLLLLTTIVISGCSKDFNLNKKDKLKNVYFSDYVSNNDFNTLDKVKLPYNSTFDSFIIDNCNNYNSYIAIENNNKYGLLDSMGNVVLECEYYSPDFYVYSDYVIGRYKTDLVDDYKIIKISESKEVVSKKAFEISYFDGGLVCINGVTYDLNGSATEILGDKNLSSINLNDFDRVIKMGKEKVLIKDRTVIVLNKKNKYINKYTLDSNYNIFPLRKNNLLLQKVDVTTNDDYSFIKDGVRYKLKTYLLKIKSGDKKAINFDMLIESVNHYNDEKGKYEYGRKVNKGNICYGYPIVSKTLQNGIYTLFNNNMSLIHNYNLSITSKINKYLYFDENNIKNKRGKIITSCNDVVKCNDYVLGIKKSNVLIYSKKGDLYDDIKGEYIFSSNENVCLKRNDKYYLYKLDAKSIKELDDECILAKNGILVYQTDSGYYRYYNLNEKFLMSSIYNDFDEVNAGGSSYIKLDNDYYKKG